MPCRRSSLTAAEVETGPPTRAIALSGSAQSNSVCTVVEQPCAEQRLKPSLLTADRVSREVDFGSGQRKAAAAASDCLESLQFGNRWRDGYGVNPHTRRKFSS